MSGLQARAGLGGQPRELPELTCNVCEQEPAVGVASSTLGAFSLAYGQKCLAENADAAWALEATFLCIGPDPAEYAGWVWDIQTWRDGAYVGARQYLDECSARPGFWDDPQAPVNGG